MKRDAITTYRATKRFKMTALLMVFIFCVSNFVIPSVSVAQAQVAMPVSANNINIPLNAGIVSENYVANDEKSPLIINVQDAHLNAEAQNNISKLFKSLHKQYGINTVFIEGTGGKLNTTLLRGIPFRDIKKKIVNEYVSKGKLSGAEKYAITADAPVKLIGVDNVDVYLENVKAYLAASKVYDRLKGKLDAIESKLRNEAYSSFSKDLSIFVENKDSFMKQELNPLEYTRFLIELANKKKIDLKKYKNFSKLVALEIFQNKIDIDSIIDETRELIDNKLLEVASEDDVNLLAVSEMDHSAGKIKTYDFYSRIKKLTLKYGIDIRKYENVNRYYNYLRLVEDIDAIKLMNDRRKLEIEIEKKLVRNSAEKKQLKLLKDFGVLKNIVKIKATPDDIKYFRKNINVIEKEFSFINKKELYAYKKFYYLAEQREDSFVKKTLKEMKKRKLNRAILLTGGYHSAGLKKRLKDKNVSYLVVSPRLTELPKEDLYDKVMRSYDKYFGVREGERGGTVKEFISIDPSINRDNYLSFLNDVIPNIFAQMKDKIDKAKSAKELKTYLTDEARKLLAHVDIDKSMDRIYAIKGKDISYRNRYKEIVLEKVIVPLWNALVADNEIVLDDGVLRVFEEGKILEFLEEPDNVDVGEVIDNAVVAIEKSGDFENLKGRRGEVENKSFIPATQVEQVKIEKKVSRPYGVFINALGRIGKLMVRQMIDEDDPNLELIAIGGTSIKGLSKEDGLKKQKAYIENKLDELLFDSLHRRWKGAKGEVKIEEGNVYLYLTNRFGQTKRIRILERPDSVGELPLKELGVDIVMETSGQKIYKTKKGMQGYIDAGAKYVLRSSPAGEGFQTYVRGVNDKDFDSSNPFVSGASCTTNGLTPVAKVLEKYGIMGMDFSTAHAITNSQVPLDGKRQDARKLSLLENIITTTTGAAIAAKQIIPILENKASGNAFRVPIGTASIISLNVKLKDDVDVEQIKNDFRKASETYLKGILKYDENIIVSGMMIGEKAPSVVLPGTIDVRKLDTGGVLLKVHIWYDNESGYANQMVRLLDRIAVGADKKEMPVEKESSLSTRLENENAEVVKANLTVDELKKQVLAENKDLRPRKPIIPDKPVRTAVYGMGRIAVSAIRQMVGDPRFNLVAIGYKDIDKVIRALTWDTAHGYLELNEPITKGVDEKTGYPYILINGKKVFVVNTEDNKRGAKYLKTLPWGDLGVDLVFDTTGAYKNKETLKGHLEAGAKRVVLSAPYDKKKEDMKEILTSTFIPAINTDNANFSKKTIISAASCTTNGLAPVMKVLEDEFGILAYEFDTIHSVTASQKLVDGSASKPERERSGMKNMIPTSTGAANALSWVIPSLKGKGNGVSLRVPTITGSVIHLNAVVNGHVSADEINKKFVEASMGKLKGIMDVRDSVYGSTRIITDSTACIICAESTRVVTQDDGTTQVAMIIWYDNEYGYANRMLELGAMAGNSLNKHGGAVAEKHELYVAGVGKISTIDNINVKNKRVLERVDFNVPVSVDFDENGEINLESIKITDDNRIRAELRTIRELLEKGAKYIVLVTHFEPKIKMPNEDKARKVGLPAEVIAKKLGELLPEYTDKIAFLKDSVDMNGINVNNVNRERLDKIHDIYGGKIFILDQIRFAYGEKKGDRALCDSLAELGDVYVNDAFAAFHREHASMKVNKIKEKAVGRLVEYEIMNLAKAFNAKHPAVAIFGGSKVEDKVDMINNFIDSMESGDTILIVGAMAYTFLKAKDPDIELGKSMFFKDQVDLAKRVMSAAEKKGIRLLLPVDHVVTRMLGDRENMRYVTEIPKDYMAVDIGSDTINLYKNALNGAKTVIWNGPAGVFEKKNGGFITGSKAIAEKLVELADKGADIIIGGGDTGSCIKNTGVDVSKMFISTAGGASFAFLSKKGNLPVLQAFVAGENYKKPEEKIKDVNVWTQKRPMRLMAQANPYSDFKLLKTLGVDGALVGHSEVRKSYDMKNKDVNDLLKRAHRVLGGVNTFAFGEDIHFRNEDGSLSAAGFSYLRKQIEEGLAGLSEKEMLNTIVAYEPIWAIGTGKTASKDQAEEVIKYVRDVIAEMYGREVADKITIQYGGSMSAKNAKDLMSQKNIDGGLIGGASLTKESALGLVREVVLEVRRQKKEGIFSGRVPTIGFNFKAEIGGKKADMNYIEELMNIKEFIKNNMSDIDLENEVRLYFAVTDVDVSMFAESLDGGDARELLNLSESKLPLAVNFNKISTIEPGAHTSEITMEALKLAGVKEIYVNKDDFNENYFDNLHILELQKRDLYSYIDIVMVDSYHEGIKDKNELFKAIDANLNNENAEPILVHPALLREASAYVNNKDKVSPFVITDTLEKSYQLNMLQKIIEACLIKDYSNEEIWNEVRQTVMKMVDILDDDNYVKNEVTENIVRDIKLGIEKGINLRNLNKVAVNNPKAAFAMEYHDLLDMTDSEIKAFKSNFNLDTYEKIYLFSLNDVVTEDDALKLLKDKLGIDSDKAKVFNIDGVSYNFLKQGIPFSGVDFINLYIRNKSKTDFAIKMQELNKEYVSNFIRIVSGDIKEGINFMESMANVRVLFNYVGKRQEIKGLDFTDEAKTKLGIKLMSDNVISEMLRTGIFLTDVISKAVKSKLQQEFRSKVIATYA